VAGLSFEDEGDRIPVQRGGVLPQTALPVKAGCQPRRALAPWAHRAFCAASKYGRVARPSRRAGGFRRNKRPHRSRSLIGLPRSRN